MGTQTLFLVCGVIVQFFCVFGRHNFYEYYYSRYHKGHSTTTESIISSTPDILVTSEYERESSPDYNSWEKPNDMVHTEDDNSLQNNIYGNPDDTSLRNHMYEPTVYPFDDNYNTDYSSLRIGVIIAIAVVFLCAICCVCCCIRHVCNKKRERRGFVIANQPEAAREAVPQQTALIHQPPELQQPYSTTQFLDQHNQYPPPQYQPMQQFPPMQPQFHYSPPAMQSHNPPEAPPPYEFPHKF